MFAQSTHQMTLRSKKQQPKIKKSNNTSKVNLKSWKPYTHCSQWPGVLLNAYSEHFQHEVMSML